MTFPRLSEEEFLRIAEVNVAAINAATEGLPQDKVFVIINHHFATKMTINAAATDGIKYFS